MRSGFYFLNCRWLAFVITLLVILIGVYLSMERLDRLKLPKIPLPVKIVDNIHKKYTGDPLLNDYSEYFVIFACDLNTFTNWIKSIKLPPLDAGSPYFVPRELPDFAIEVEWDIPPGNSSNEYVGFVGDAYVAVIFIEQKSRGYLFVRSEI